MSNYICSFCQDGYFKDMEYEGDEGSSKGYVANLVKCDHCKGSGKCQTNCLECEVENSN